MARAGIAAAFALSDPARAVQLAAEVSRPTHQSPVTLDACRYFAALVVGALQGATRDELLTPHFSPAPGIWKTRPLRREVARVVEGAWREPGFEPVADGSALDALALVLWALHEGTQYRDSVLLAVNRGLDADVHGALVGQLAGALQGASAIPPRWVAGVVQGARLTQAAEALLVGALSHIASA
jgi:ADP-ribosylglycohydrolase